MDDSDLVEALQNQDEARVNKILKDIVPRLVRYLEINMSASKSDAEDSVQYSMERALDALRGGNINNEDKVFSYLVSTCRNNYLKSLEKKREVNYDRIPSSQFHEPNQIASILNEEREQILKQCLEELKGMYRRFIEYWFDHPDSDAETAASHFDISVSNVWTRKHRVIKKLNQCYKRKSNQ